MFGWFISLNVDYMIHELSVIECVGEKKKLRGSKVRELNSIQCLFLSYIKLCR